MEGVGWGGIFTSVGIHARAETILLLSLKNKNNPRDNERKKANT